jgi:hypothetical protein
MRRSSQLIELPPEDQKNTTKTEKTQILPRFIALLKTKIVIRQGKTKSQFTSQEQEKPHPPPPPPPPFFFF